MIHHLSIAARDPMHVAEVLAEFMAGTAVPFPPNPGSFFALQNDEHGTGVEVYPAGSELRPCGAEGAGFARRAVREKAFGPTHFALSVAADAARIEAIAQREDWPCFSCSRGGFGVVEVWIEGETMVELLPPAFARRYLDMAPALAAAPAARSSAHPTDADGVRDTGLFLCVG
jgi:hypothetical protein